MPFSSNLVVIKLVQVLSNLPIKARQMLKSGYSLNILQYSHYTLSPTSMSQHSTLYTLSASSIACNDSSDDGDDRGSSGDSTTGGSEDGSSTSLSPCTN